MAEPLSSQTVKDGNALSAREERGLRDTGRTEAFSDGVFAVAITLLAIDLKPPHLQENDGNIALVNALFAQWPAYIAFIISFLTVLILWINHHTIVDHIARADRQFLLLNGLLLLLVSAVPFPTAMVANYLMTPAANAVCAVVCWNVRADQRGLQSALAPRSVQPAASKREHHAGADAKHHRCLIARLSYVPDSHDCLFLQCLCWSRHLLFTLDLLGLLRVRTQRMKRHWSAALGQRCCAR